MQRHARFPQLARVIKLKGIGMIGLAILGYVCGTCLAFAEATPEQRCAALDHLVVGLIEEGGAIDPTDSGLVTASRYQENARMSCRAKAFGEAMSAYSLAANWASRVGEQ